jgi:hypothetical protein
MTKENYKINNKGIHERTNTPAEWYVYSLALSKNFRRDCRTSVRRSLIGILDSIAATH